jgi:phospho-N-acetylmuramoyl-pentapeptide-transferase
MTCNGDFMASNYDLWHVTNFTFLFRFEWPTMLTVFLIGWVIAREVIPVVIRVQRKAAIGQQVYESGPAAHLAKQGTPTMGGLAFPLAAVGAAIFLTNARNDHEQYFIAFLVAAVAAIGITDDFLKIKRRTALGLRARSKMVLLTIVAAVAAFGFLHDQSIFCNSIIVTGNYEWWFGHLVILPDIWFYILAIAAVVGCANAVNLTDGVDGLAASVALPPLVVLFVLDGGGVGLAVAGALIVFLRYNRHPANVFMGDTGSLSLGALLAFIAIKEHVLLFLPLLGVVFVIEALSVIAQVVSFKLTGKRIFKMSPLHHHFELTGWSEQRITRTLTLVSLLAAVIFCAVVNFSNVRVLWHW